MEPPRVGWEEAATVPGLWERLVGAVRDVTAPVQPWLEANPVVLGALAVVSTLTFLGSLLLLPPLIARLPADYFVAREAPPSRWRTHHPHVRVVVFVIRNVIGTAMLLAGLAMLALPGQGILTLIAAIVVMDFPGKRRLERRTMGAAMRRRSLDRALRWIRRRAGKPPLLPPHDEEPVHDGPT